MAWKNIVDMHPNGVKVRDALRQVGVETDIVETEESSPTAVRAAEQLGISVGQIANSLIFSADGVPVLVLASGAHKVDTEIVARFLGAQSVHRPDADFVREHTGQPIGGVAPLGHPRPVQTIVDDALAQYDEVWAAGGHPHYVFRTTYDELVRITGGTPLAVGVT
jgi:prolyl-tRNA editing enzyme YbaK/EbsC (Cys-tRNA(Pro) deacylase)